MALADFVNSAVDDIAAIVFAAFFVAIVLRFFGGFIIETLGDLRRAWKQHMRD